MNGVLVISTRNGACLYAARWAPNFGLPGDFGGASGVDAGKNDDDAGNGASSPAAMHLAGMLFALAVDAASLTNDADPHDGDDDDSTKPPDASSSHQPMSSSRDGPRATALYTSARTEHWASCARYPRRYPRSATTSQHVSPTPRCARSSPSTNRGSRLAPSSDSNSTPTCCRYWRARRVTSRWPWCDASG